MENVNDKNANGRKLSFPQRNWFLICVIVAILSPLVVHWLQVGAREKNYKEATKQRTVDTGATGKADTSYKVASPPNSMPQQGAGKAAGGNSAAGDTLKH